MRQRYLGPLSSLFLLILLLFSACGRSGSDTENAANAAPELVIWIVADDLGLGDISLYPQGRYDTPNLRRLADNGVLFDTAYAASSASGPSRAALMTGRHPGRLGYEYDNGPAARDRDQGLGLPEDEYTAGQMFKLAGFRTAMVGVWHLGGVSPISPRFPGNRGFDRVYGVMNSGIAYADNPNSQISFLADRSSLVMPSRTGDERLISSDQGRDIRSERYATFDFVEQAIDLIITRAPGTRQFVYLALPSPARPLQIPAEYLDRVDASAPAPQQYREAMIAALDDAVGRILDALEVAGLAEQAVVLFTSDNGCDLRSEGCGCGVLRGGAYTHYEGGVRVPLLLRWPGRIAAGQSYGQPVSLMDVLPTMLEGFALEPPPGVRFDGKSLWPHLNKPSAPGPHESFVWTRRPATAVRLGSMKLVTDPQADSVELFDVSLDPGETRNLADPQSEDFRILQAQAQVAMGFLRDPLWLSSEKLSLEACGDQVEIYR